MVNKQKGGPTQKGGQAKVKLLTKLSEKKPRGIARRNNTKIDI